MPKAHTKTYVTEVFVSSKPIMGKKDKQERKEGVYMIFQVGSTLLDACVLSYVRKADTYGYMLTKAIKDNLDISESTLYPVLRRLLKENYLATYDEPYQGRNRRYYKITEEGDEMCNIYKKEWGDYKERIDKMIEGGESGE